MRRLDEILVNINDDIAAALKLPKVSYYTQAELQEKDGKTFPMLNNGNQQGKIISPDRSQSLQSYHRVLNSETDTDYTRGKGRYPYKMRTYTIRNVWIGTLKSLPQRTYESNDDIKNDVYEAFPTILDSKELVRTITENVNKQEILEAEFAGHDMNNLLLELVVFYIDYEVKQNVKCN